MADLASSRVSNSERQIRRTFSFENRDSMKAWDPGSR